MFNRTLFTVPNIYTRDACVFEAHQGLNIKNKDGFSHFYTRLLNSLNMTQWDRSIFPDTHFSLSLFHFISQACLIYFNIRWKKRKMTLYVFCWLLASQRLFFCWWEYPRNVKHIACWNQLLLRKMDHPLHLLRGQIWGTWITWPPSTPVLAPAERTVNSQAWHGMTRLERVSGPLKFSPCQEFEMKNFKWMKQSAWEGKT